MHKTSWPILSRCQTLMGCVQLGWTTSQHSEGPVYSGYSDGVWCVFFTNYTVGRLD